MRMTLEPGISESMGADVIRLPIAVQYGTCRAKPADKHTTSPRSDACNYNRFTLRFIRAI